MRPGLTKKNTLFIFIHILYLFFFTSIIFSFRAVSSISIAAILLTGFITLQWPTSHISAKKSMIFFLSGCVICFLLTIVSLLYTNNSDNGWSHVRLKTGLLVIPLAAFFTTSFIRLHKQQLLLHFTTILLIACLFCLSIAVSRYSNTTNASVFFYHELVSPFSQHAVYFSVFVFIVLVYLMENSRRVSSPVSKPICLLLIAFFSVFLFLLSSKLTIVLYGLYILFFLSASIRAKTINRSVIAVLLLLFILATGILLLTKNPVSKRFNDLMSGDIGITRKENFNPGDYFNGLQLRLLEWRFVSEILTENKRWIAGISPGDAQQQLDQKYISKNMYIGDPGGKDKGFLGYNTHNQFLQSLLQHGIFGAGVFLFTWLALLALAWTKKKREYTAIIILLLVYAWVESILETQYGIVIFTFFPLFLFPDQTRVQPDKSA